MKIRSKMMLGFGAVTFALLIAQGAILFTLINTNLTAKINKELDNTLESATQMVNGIITNSVKADLRGLAQENRDLIQNYYNKVHAGAMTKGAAMAEIKKLFEDPVYGRIGITGYLAGVDSSGVLVIHPKSEGANVGSYDFVKKAIAMKNGYLEYMWKNTGETEERSKACYVSYFEPWDILVWASSYKSEFSSIINPQDLKEYILSIKVGTTGYPFILDQKGNLIIHPNLDGQNLMDTKDARGNLFIKKILDTKNGKIDYLWQNPGEKSTREKFAYFRYLPDTNWTLVISSYTEEYYGILTIFRNILLLAISLTILITVFVVFLISGKISIVIKELSFAFTRLAEGELTYKTKLISNDELGEMSMDYNRVIETLSGSLHELKKVASDSENLSSELSSNSTELSATVNQMSATMQSMDDRIQTVHHEVENSSRNVSSINDNIKNVIKLIDIQSEAVADSSSAITQMIANIGTIEKATSDKKNLAGQLVQLANIGERDMQETVVSITDISKDTETILGLIQIINNVASQTNLLAMNAAIEAAHAGNAGRGFAVVADEIRKLAETSGANAKSISVSLKAIAQKISSASSKTVTTNEAIKQIIVGIGDVTDSMNETLMGLQEITVGSKQITEAITGLKQITNEVKDSGQDMNKGTDLIMASMTHITSLTQESSKGIAEVNIGSQEISKSVICLTDLSITNSETIKSLKRAISRFRTE